MIRTMKRMPLWEEYGCGWLETQIQAGKWKKLGYALRAYLKGLFVVWRYDVVHFHAVPDQSMYVQLPVFLMALLGRKKILLHLHVGNQLGMDMCVKNRLAHWCMRKADLLVLLAHQFEPLMDKYWADVKTPRTVVYNAIDENTEIVDLNIKNTNLSNLTNSFDKEKIILFAGELNDNKSADVLVNAFAKVLNITAAPTLSHTLRYVDWKLVLLGSGPNEEKLSNLVNELNLQDRVEMPGYLFGKEKEDYFRRASIYAMCSQFEGFPMVVLEAWENRMAVVSTPVGGLPDVMEVGKNCLSFDFGDVNGLATQLAKLMKNEALRQEMGAYSQQFIREHFSMEKINADWCRVYESLC